MGQNAKTRPEQFWSVGHPRADLSASARHFADGKKQPSMHPTRKVGYGRIADVTGPRDRAVNGLEPADLRRCIK